MKRWMLGGIILLLALPIMTGCSRARVTVETRTTTDPRERVQVYESERGGPPPWAPAHGYRKKMEYRYYPNEEVYYNLKTRRYTYKGSYGWEVSFSLPSRISLGRYVEIDLEGSHPEQYHHHVKTHHAASAPEQPGRPNDAARTINPRGNGKFKG